MRHDVDSTGKLSLRLHKASQDAWIFSVPMFGAGAEADAQLAKFMDDAAVDVGTPSCDHLLVGLLLGHGLRVLNPALELKVVHMHVSEVLRDYHNRTTPSGDLRELPVLIGLGSLL